MKLYKTFDDRLKDVVFFCYAKNAKAADPHYEKTEVSEEVFKSHAANGLINDLEQWKEKHPESELLNDDEIQEIEKAFEEDAKTEIESLEQKISELQAENQKLKTKSFDFETVQKVISEKSRLLKELRIFQAKRTNILDWQKQLSEESEEGLDYQKAELNFKAGGHYSKDNIFSLSNKLVIDEILNNVISKIDERISTLKVQIAEIEF